MIIIDACLRNGRAREMRRQQHFIGQAHTDNDSPRPFPETKSQLLAGRPRETRALINWRAWLMF